MTREEAIKILKNHHMWTGEPEEINDVRTENEALYMAIKSLESREDELEEAYAHGWTAAEDKYYQMIVRCKDCKWSEKFNGGKGNENKLICNSIGDVTDADGYCHCGERRDNDS